MTHRLVPLCLVILVTCFASAADQPGRYVAGLSNGRRVEGHRLSTRQMSSAARLDGKLIAQGKLKLRWLIDRSLPRFDTNKAENGFVELVGGDRLPGRVVGLVDGMLRVRITQSYGLPRTPYDTSPAPVEIRVRSGEVRRIAMKPTNRPYQPGMLLENDGRRSDFRGVRFGDASVRLLLKSGIRNVAWHDIAELHLPRQDDGEAYYRQLAAMDKSLAQPIVRVETTGGLIASGSQVDEKVFVDRTRALQYEVKRRQLLHHIKRTEESMVRQQQKWNAQAKRNHKAKSGQQAVVRALAKRGVHVPPGLESFVATRFKYLVYGSSKNLSDEAVRKRVAKGIRDEQNRRGRRKIAIDWQARHQQRFVARLEMLRGAIAELPGSASDPNSWYQRVQPAWTPDELWVPIGTIRTLTIFEAHEPPLTRFLPVESSNLSSLGPPRPARVDANVVGEPLSRDGKLLGWGIGVHAPSALRFDLPAEAISVRVGAGLDDRAGDGGCVRVAIYRGDDAQRPLWRSGFLIGTSASADSGRIMLPAVSGRRSIVLVSDTAHQGRPRSADPLNIRDLVDWTEPVVMLDRKKLAKRVAELARE
jgi:hypothetical protein